MRYLVAFILPVLFFVPSCAKMETKTKSSLSDDTEELIDLLANSNKNVNSAKRAYNKLLKMKGKALPALVAHSDDKRIAARPYQGIYSIMGEATVGYVCYEIIACIVGFESGKHAAFCPVFLNHRSHLKKWYQQRQDWSLAEIQTEILHCRIKHIEETDVDFIWAMDEQHKKRRLGQLRRKIKKIDKSKTQRHYAWQEPPNLDEDKVLELAQAYLSNKGYQLQDYSEDTIYYVHLIDCWAAFFKKDISSDVKQYLMLTIDDTTSSIEFEEWIRNWDRPS